MLFCRAASWKAGQIAVTIVVLALAAAICPTLSVAQAKQAPKQPAAETLPTGMTITRVRISNGHSARNFDRERRTSLLGNQKA